MDCPFYTAVATYVKCESLDMRHAIVWTELFDIDSRETDLENLEEILNSFPNYAKENRKWLKTLIVLGNNMKGGPKPILDYG